MLLSGHEPFSRRTAVSARSLNSSPTLYYILAAGEHRATWDGRDDAGRRVAPGVYLYRIHAGAFRSSRKLSILP